MKKITVDLMNDFRYISNLQANTDKTYFTYISKKANISKNKYDTSLYLYKDNKNICLIENKDIDFKFWYDNNSIVYTTKTENDDDESTTFFKLTLNEGEAKKIFTINLAVNKIIKLDDYRYVLTANISSLYPTLFNYSKEDRIKHFEKIKNDDFKIEIEEIPFFENGASYTNYLRNHIFIYNAKDNSLIDLISNNNETVYSFDVDTRNNKLVYVSNIIENKMPLYNNITEYDLSNNKFIKIYDNNDRAFEKVLYTKDYILTFSTDMKYLGINENNKIILIDRNTYELNIFDEDISTSNSTGSDARLGYNNSILVDYDNNSFDFIQTIENRAVLSRFKNNKITVLKDVKGSIDGFVYINNELYILAFIKEKLAEIYKANNLEQITYFNDEIFKDKYVAKVNEFTFISNNDEIKAYSLLPENFDKNKKYKTIIDVHGGPKTVYSTIYYHEMQVWANMGYIVLFTNPHGSDGRGNDFSDIRGKYGTIDYTDILNMLDYACNIYPIDTDKLGLTGGSYGGFMTNWIVTHTNKFKCAVTQRSISNWVSMFGVSDIGYYFADDQNKTKYGDENFFDTLWDFSPLKYVKNCKTPLLIIHSDADYRCPIDQAYQLFTSLKNQGTDTKLIVYKNENHELSRSGKPLARLSRLNNITNWFEKYLNKELYES